MSLLLRLLRAPIGCRLLRAEFDGSSVTLHLATTHPAASCPACGRASSRVHSRYARRLASEPTFGSRVRLVLTVRRFFCTTDGCTRRIFAEPLDGFAARHARSTRRLDRVHLALGSALGGEAGARLSRTIAAPASPATLLRRVKRAASSSASAPRIVGVDDWAWRKGLRYGTIVVDLEAGDVVDLLPDRDAQTLKTWLEAHPQVELVSRDRSSSYASAASEAAPNARQVADRWHLLKNAREAVERLLERHQPAIARAFQEEKGAVDQVEGEPSAREPAAGSRGRRERFERVHELRRDGRSIRDIGRVVGLARNSVRRWLRLATCPDWNPGRPRRSTLDEHRTWIDDRLAEGPPNASALHRELGSRGVKISYAALNRYVIKRLAEKGRSRPRADAARPKAAPPPSPKRLSFDWIRRDADRLNEAAARLEAIRELDPDLASSLALLGEFAALIRKQGAGTLQDWLSRAEAGPGPEIRDFAASIRRDESALDAAITTRWNNGPVEGHVNRLKTIKRQMYGRAGFQLLRARVLNAA